MLIKTLKAVSTIFAPYWATMSRSRLTAQFDDGKPADEALIKTCYPCHAPAKGNDLVFTHYAP